MELLLLMMLIVNMHSLSVQSLDSSLYDTAILRCSFPFIRDSEGLSVIWEKKNEDGRSLIVHRIQDGQDNLADQDINYTDRTELSKEFFQGSVDLTLRDVTYKDEGTYYCRAANKQEYGVKEVKLSIKDLNADNAIVTVVHIDGKERLKCVDIGVFRNPWVRWYDGEGKILFEYIRPKITDYPHGRKMVESVLDLDVEKNKHYFCVVREGRLKRTTRAVISDEEPVTFPEIKLPE